MMHYIEFRHIRYFLAVADELHFRKAAESLYISQPGLSRQIQDMESTLGISLFKRTNRKVVLTEAGEYLKNELSDFTRSLEESFRHAKLIHQGLSGELRLGYVGSAVQKAIPKLLLNYEKKHPQILINLKELDNQTQIQNLLNHEIDVGFVRLDQVPDNLVRYPIFSEPFSLVLPKDHEINESNFEDMAQLKDESFILFNKDYSPSYYKKVMRIFEDSGFTPKVTHNSINSSTIYKLVEHHFGISIVPSSLTPASMHNIKFVELSDSTHKTTLSAVWLAKSRNPVIHDFIEEIKRNDFSSK